MMCRVAVLLGLSIVSAFGADWSPKLAADYLDARQKEWFEWPKANSGAKPCISCHTGLPYLMARPALRRALGEKEPTKYETGLLASLSSRVEKAEPDTPALGVESVMAALFLRTPAAYNRMWALQIRGGESAGAWKWFSLDLDPWEQPESALFGAALATIAVRGAPEDYQSRPEVRERIAALTAFLNAPHEGQPLHNRLMIAWASEDSNIRKQVATEAFARQSADGGWTMESLGPFKTHVDAPAAKPGSNTYATAFATLALLRSGSTPRDPRVAKALHWLRTHQSQHGYWYAESMNKQYEPGSMEIRFMRDASTAFAALALLEP
jgi:hypothetical protein